MAAPKLDEEVYARRAAAVRDFITTSTTERGYPPSMREIAEHLGVVPSTAHRTIHRMIDEGLLIGHASVGRQLRVSETVLPETGATA